MSLIPSKKPKILHFFPDHYNWGGIQVYLSNTLPKLLARSEFEIVAACTQNSKLTHRLKDAGIKVHELSFPFKKKHLLASWFRKPLIRTLDFRVYQKLLKILDAEQPDLVHVHSGRVEYSCIKKAGFKLAYTYHGYGAVYNMEPAPSWFHKRYYELMRPLFSNLIPYLDGMTIVSQYEKNRLYRSDFIPPSFEPRVLYNGIPQINVLDDEKSTLRQQLNIPENVKLVCLASRLVAAKNAKAFINVAHKIMAKKPQDLDIYFMVAGDGKQAKEFEQAFNNKGPLSSHGNYLGFRDDVPVLMAMSDVSVSTSLQEGFGLRVIESFIQGTPFVGYHIGGQVELIPEELKPVLLAPENDEEALADNIIKLLQQPDDKTIELSQQLKKQATHFSMEKHVNQLTDFYRGIFAS